MMRRVLLLGGTGVIGTFLTPELRKLGYEVVITSRSAHTSDDPGVTYVCGNAKDDAFLDALLEQRCDVIVDFLIYSTEAFQKRCEKLVSHTSHYVFLSSYRVYGDNGCAPIREDSPRLLESVDDPEYLKTDEYGLTKARQEDILRACGRQNFTIIRPAITYGGDRFQLGTMEANEFLVRALHKKAVVFPKEMLDKRTTMTWAGDVGRMIARLVLNETAYGETYPAATAENRTWKNVLDLYKKALGMQVKEVPLDTYARIVGRPWQIRYDRMLHRVIDNSKICRATGIRQSELMPLAEGLRIELYQFTREPKFRPVDEAMQKRFDAVCAAPQKKQEPPREKGLNGMLHRAAEYRRRGVLKKVVREKLYRITPLRKAVHGAKRLLGKK